MVNQDIHRHAFERLHDHAFFLYGVIVGFAIEKGLENTIPHLLAPPAEPPARRYEVLRLIVFLSMTVRLYLSTTIFFDSAHATEAARDKYKVKYYALDFLLGFTQFLLFFGWAFTVDAHSKPRWLFITLLAIILLFDWVWYFVSKNYEPDTHYMVTLRVGVSLTTLLLGAVVYLLFFYVFELRAEAEPIALCVALAITLFDIEELTIGQKRLKKWLSKRFPPR